MSLEIKVEKKKKPQLRIRRVRKDLFKNSPLTRKIISYGVEKYGFIGAFYGSQILADMSFMITPTEMVFAKFGESGIGKTVSEKIAIKVLEKHRNILDLSGSKGITPAGLTKVYRRANSDEANEKDIQNWHKIVNADMVYVEDFAMLSTVYVRDTTAIVLHRLPYDTSLSDLTSSGESEIQINMGKTKRVLFSGTPDIYDELTSKLSYDEFMNRRCLYLMLWLSPKEWKQREKFALGRYYITSTLNRETALANEWIKVIREGLKIGKIQQLSWSIDEKELKTINKERKLIYRELIKFKRIPESALEKIDGLAMGHALINGRIEVLTEDYEFISLLLWKFIITSVMRHRDLSIFNEVCRRNGKGVRVRELADFLRIKAKSENIPELALSMRTIKTHVELSVFLNLEIERSNVPHAVGESIVKFSDETLKLVTLWKRVIRRIVAENGN